MKLSWSRVTTRVFFQEMKSSLTKLHRLFPGCSVLISKERKSKSLLSKKKKEILSSLRNVTDRRLESFPNTCEYY